MLAENIISEFCLMKSEHSPLENQFPVAEVLVSDKELDRFSTKLRVRALTYLTRSHQVSVMAASLSHSIIRFARSAKVFLLWWRKYNKSHTF